MRPFHTLTERGKARRHRRTVEAALVEYGLSASELTSVAIDTNFVYRITADDGTRYALRVHRQSHQGQHLQGLSDIELECWWVRRLAADGIPVADVVPNRSGRAVTTVQGIPGVPAETRCVLFRWLPGHPPDNQDPSYWEELGRLAARLHRQAGELELPAWAQPRRWDSVFPYEHNQLSDPTSAGVLSARQRHVLDRAIATLNPYLAGLYDNSGCRRPRLIHGDLHDENVLSRHGRLSVFDFEDLIIGHPEHDLAVALYGPYYNRPDFAAVAAAMRRGYEAVAPWPIDGLEALEPLFAARVLGLINFCIALGADYLDYVSMLVDRMAAFVEGGVHHRRSR